MVIDSRRPGLKNRGSSKLDEPLGHPGSSHLSMGHESVHIDAAPDASARQARGTASRRIVLTFT